MDSLQHLSISFYRHLGYLFYAIAASDGTVMLKEFEVLKTRVKTNWLDIDKTQDDYGEDAGFQIEIVFDWADYQKLSSKQAFVKFKEFYLDHYQLFTKDIKGLIWRTAKDIAHVFYGPNKSELVILSKLKALLAKEF